MAKLKILKDGDTALRLKSRPVSDINKRILTLLDDMTETMRHADGVGLAAPQVGVLRRVVVIECEPGEVLELINPVIIERRGSQHEIEGCLSVPGRQGYTDRPAYVKVEALNRDGALVTLEGEGLLARAFCHEIDHLDGILYIDHAEMVTEE
ncbi:MAG: peptide deformylase [Ruminococcaceae bacterium]|nr:peptide deformylase [Oscillospiraceae bacterium]